MKNQIKIMTFVIVIVIGLSLIGYIILIPKTTATMNRFESIPQKPNDFDAYTRDIWKGAFVELCDISEKYWMQPEFYGSAWENAKEDFYNNPDYSRWGVYGQGNMPREIGYTFENLKQGEEFELCTFFHNGFGIWTYQGFQLVSNENEYFDVEIAPNLLTMSPTFPVFENGWVQKIKIKLIAKQDILVGSYKIIIDTTAPPEKYAREETKRVLQMTINKDKYKEECFRFLKDEERCNYLINNREKKYFDGGAYQPSEPLLKLKIQVK